MNVVHLKRLINIAMKLIELLEISNPFKTKPKSPKIEPVLNPEPEIAAVPVKPGKISLPANASSWTPEKQLAFKDGAEHLSKVLYNRQKKGVKTSTLEAYQEVEKRVGAEHIKDPAFVQDVFEAARKSTNERIAAEAQALQGGAKAAPEVKPAAKETPPTEKPNAEKKDPSWMRPVDKWNAASLFGKYDMLLTLGLWGGNGAAVGIAINDYYDARDKLLKSINGELTIKDEKTGKPIVWTQQTIEENARFQHTKLVGTLAGLLVIPAVPMAALKFLRWLGLIIPVAKTIVLALSNRIQKGVTTAIRNDKTGKIAEWSDRTLNTAWAAFVAAMLADTKFSIEVGEDANKNPITKDYSIREILVIAAMGNTPWGKGNERIATALNNIWDSAWNAALQSVTGHEATSLATDMKRAQAANPQQPTSQPSTNTPTNKQPRRDAEGVEIVNWD